jgi:uncharacterized membrane protein
MSDHRPPVAPGRDSPVPGRGASGPRPHPGHPARVAGVDLARGVALLGMMAVHVFDTFDRYGAPTVATTVAGGRSATTFVLVAGVSLAFLSGGRQVVNGGARRAARTGIAVRAVLIGILGLALGYIRPEQEVILPYYAMLFLLAIPLLGLRPRTLAVIVAGTIAGAPLLVLATFDADIPALSEAGNPTFGTVAEDPAGLLTALLLTGFYPTLAYLAYLGAGLALGRLDLSSLRTACRLLVGGLALALTARVVSAVVLFPMGGLRHLLGQVPPGPDPARGVLLWDPPEISSWWYLALPAPHSTTPINMAHTLGSALAVLGAALLLTRLPAVARLLRPVAVAGAMTLTLYCGHLLVLATGILPGPPTVRYLLLVAGALAFGLGWRRWFGQGPLERLVAAAAGRARRAVATPARHAAAT